MNPTNPFDPAIDAVRAAIALDPVPQRVIDAARASLTWLTIDAELASLSFDSLDAGELVGARGAGGPRSISFEYQAVAIELELTTTSTGSLSLQGQVAPGEPVAIEIHQSHSESVIVADVRPNGRFAADGLQSGSIRLLVRFAPNAGPAMLLTEWVGC
jgi:hypothetical protein